MKRTRLREFTGPALAQVAFPLGGIGTGMVSLGGRGNLQDWEVWNKPNKGGRLELTFFALRVQPQGGPAVSRILERQYLPPFTGFAGFAPGGYQLPGVTRFPEVVFRGEYPLAWVDFQDRQFPVKVRLEAFNPFIPLNVADSSIPGAIFRYTMTNPRQHPVDVSLLAVMQNPVGVMAAGETEPARQVDETLNSYRESDGLRGLYFTAPGVAWQHPHFGTAALTTDWPAVDVQTRLDRGGWWDRAHRLWDEFTATGRLTPLVEHTHGQPLNTARDKRRGECGALCLRLTLPPGASRTLPVYLHWHHPNTTLWAGMFPAGDSIPVRTYVANQFEDAWDAARYTQRNLPRLEAETRRWHATLFESSLPAPVLDAVSSQMSIIRSPTVLRLADGNLYAWEGCGDQGGCCHGNCTHVWNYEQALAFLFPALERTMRRIDFGPNMKPDGAMQFRCHAPAGALNSTWPTHPCVDGQMGNVIQAYRDWQLSGDDAFLRELWPNVKRALEYAWTAPNGWDPDKDGVMEGCQPNTYDIEFYGPNTMLGSCYLGALRAAEEMARYLGDAAKAAEYRAVYESGRARTETELWNGEYFFQKVEVLPGREIPPNLIAPAARGERHETGAVPKYQYGDGCLADQLLGQLCSHVAGLGHILDPSQVRRALQAVFNHNFRDPIGGFDNVQRVYALQDEAGLLLCSWPRGNRPALPFVYSDEVWTGIEYQVAAHLIYEGLVQEGLRVVAAVRNRHDGVRRNPWNEFEAGWHYARALASWSLIPALSGVRYSAVEQSLTFAPKLPAPFTCVVVAGTAWGLLTVTKTTASLAVRFGQLTLREFGPPEDPERFTAPRTLAAGETLRITRR